MPSRAPEQGTLAVGDERFATLELETPATPESIDRVQDMIADLVAGTADDLDFTDRMRFETALVEIIGNVVEHGIPAAGCVVRMHVSVQRSADELTAVITDDGVEAHIDIDGATMSADDDESGRGLAMARALATELRYERVSGRNRWTVRCVAGE